MVLSTGLPHIAHMSCDASTIFLFASYCIRYGPVRSGLYISLSLLPPGEAPAAPWPLVFRNHVVWIAFLVYNNKAAGIEKEQ